MKKYLLLPVFCLCITLLSAQSLNWAWAKDFGYANNDETYNIAKDKSGNIYMTGHFAGDSIRFGAFNLTKPSFFLSSIFIVKLDSAGTVLWAKTVSGEAVSHGIAVDKNNNVIVGGAFYTTLNFGSGVFLSNGGESDIFFAKYDTSGNLVWAKKAGGTKTDYCMSLGVDSLGNIYSTGTIGMSVTAYFGAIALTNANSIPDIYLSKYDPAGNEIWAMNYGGLCTSHSSALAADAEGNTYITGYFYNSSISFDAVTLSNSGGIDAFLTKFDKDGTALWANKVGGAGDEYGKSIALDGIGNVCLGGDFTSSSLNVNGTVLNTAGSSDAFITSYTKLGSFNWAKRFGGTSTEYGNSVSCDAASNVFFSFHFESPVITGFGSHSNNGSANTLVVKLKHDGTILGSVSAGGTGTDVIRASVADNNALYITGFYSGTESVFGSSTLLNGGSADVFFAKLDLGHNCNTFSSILVDSCGVDSTSLPGGGMIYNAGIYYDTLQNAASCDSIITFAFIKKVINTTVTVSGNMFTANETGATYEWFDCATLLPATSASDPNFIATSPGSYYVEITKMGCTENSDCIVYCPSTSSTINVTACNSYTVPSGDTAYTSDGTYVDVIPNFQNCDSLITIQLDIDMSTAFASYTAAIDSLDSLTMNITNTSTGSIVSYLWDFGDGNTSVLQYPTHTYASTGNYLVCLTVYDALCSDTYCDSTSNAVRAGGINKINVMAPVITGIAGVSEGDYLKVYPNPTSNAVNIETSDNDVLLEVYNTIGQLVYSTSLKNGKQTVILPEENGLYFIKLSGKSKITTVRVLKE